MLNDLNQKSKFLALKCSSNGLHRIYMDHIHAGVQYFQFFMDHFRCFFESFIDFFGVFGYIVAFFELATCLRGILGMWNVLELKIFGINFSSVQTLVFQLIFGKNN